MTISLHDFVKQTLLDITNAVYDARRKAPLSIAPGYVEGKKQLQPQMIESAVQVVASEEKTQNGEGQISVPAISILKAGLTGALGTSDEKSITQSLRFSVPVCFQAPRDKDQAEPGTTAQRR